VSVQNALRIIKKYREKDSQKLTTSATLKDLVDLSLQEDLSCSIEELKKAFQIDWDMRWLKNS
jgi:hypothetical protein